MTATRRLQVVLIWTVGVLAATALMVVGPGQVSSPAQAADLSQFDPGNIISDEIFFDSGAMSAAQVQQFLDVKGVNCSRGADGSVCLKAYRMDTATRAATAYCPRVYQGAAQETAASIIYKVAQACRVNPQVLLVKLQKEVGFVRSINPTAKMYQRAMGYGCPDNSTGECNSAYGDLHKQLYSAASQFQRYVQNPLDYGYRAGIVNKILYHPYNDCGRQDVFIENGATAALYNYTPYVPNAAALNAGYAEGDGCSAYGNRNFFSFFTDWFGSTQSSGSGVIQLKYEELGGPAVIGNPVAATQCGLVADGCARAYTQGSIYWSPASGAAYVTGPSLGSYWNNGAVGGPLGYPIASSATITGGAATAFQGGSIYWSSATGARVVTKEMLSAWWNSGGITGPLGYPIADSAPVPGGRATAFSGGSVYWSQGTGAQWLSGAVLGRYWGTGVTQGPLGFPIGSLGTVAGGQAAAFQGGSIYSSADTGARAVTKEVLPKWWATGGVTGALGFPIADSTTVAGGRLTEFEAGSVYWSQSTGAHWIGGDVLEHYVGEGGPAVLGFPVADQGPVTGGSALAVQKASIYSSPSTGTHAVYGPLRTAWWAKGGITGPLGFPTADVAEIPGADGLVGEFAGGSLYWSKATGGRSVQGDIATYYAAEGGPAVLGFPIADQGPVTGGSALATQKVSIYSSASTGAHAVRGGVRTAWWAKGGITGPLGFPTADVAETPGVAGLVGQFARGTLYWSAATGGRSVQGDIATYYAAEGGPAVLGFPIADQGPVTGGSALATQKVSIYSSASTGTHAVYGGVRTAWWAKGGITGPLGFPTGDVAETPGVAGLAGEFAGGRMYWSTATGGHVVTGDIAAYYTAQGGPAVLGFPIADQGLVTGGTALAAQKFSIYSSPATGTHSLYGAVRTVWWATGGITGPLGFPTTDVTVVAGTGGTTGFVVDFSGGAVYWSAATGARVVRSAVLIPYRSAGGPMSAYGWPVSDTYAVPGGSRNDFQVGQITG